MVKISKTWKFHFQSTCFPCRWVPSSTKKAKHFRWSKGQGWTVFCKISWETNLKHHGDLFFFLDLNVTYNLRLMSCFRMLARWKVSALRLEVSTSCWWWLDHWAHPNQNTLRWKMFWCLIMTIPLNIAAWSVSLVSQQESYDTYHGHGRSPVRRNAFGHQWCNGEFIFHEKKMDTIILEEKPISKNGFFKFLPWFSLDLFWSLVHKGMSNWMYLSQNQHLWQHDAATYGCWEQQIS